MATPFTVYKLIVLYMLQNSRNSLTNSQISEFILDHEYTNYFNVQNAFAELLDADLIRCSNTYNTSYYEITPAGKKTLELFGNTLSREIRQEIDEYLKENNHEIVQKVTLISDYNKNANGEYTATCRLIEKNAPIFELRLSVPDEEDALHICNNWRTSSDDLYAFAVKKLLRPSEETE